MKNEEKDELDTLRKENAAMKELLEIIIEKHGVCPPDGTNHSSCNTPLEECPQCWRNWINFKLKGNPS